MWWIAGIVAWAILAFCAWALVRVGALADRR